MGAKKCERSSGLDANTEAILNELELAILDDDDPVDRAVDEYVAREKEAEQIPVVVSVHGKLTCSQCRDHRVRVAAFFRTEDCRRTICVCAACLNATSEAADVAGGTNG